MDMEENSLEKMMETIPIINNKIKGVAVNQEGENVFVLGATGSGKSSLICYLNGAEIEYRKNRAKYEIINRSKGEFP